MAVDLPPALPPVLGSAEAIRRSDLGTGYTVAFQKFSIHMVDGSVVDEAAARDAVRNAQDLSAAVRAIAREAYTAGYPAAQLTYARQGDQVFLHVAPGEVQRVDAPEILDHYFDDLPAGILRAHELEPRRTLASLHADRAARDFGMELDGEALVIRERDSDRQPARAYVEVGNPGNRFVGRHFVDIFVQGSNQLGTQLTGFGRSSLVGLNKPDDAEDYGEHLLSVSQVTEYGVWNLSAHRIGYDQTVLNTPLASEILEGEASWLYPVYADIASRVTTTVTAERTRKQAEIRTDGTLIQKELYTSAEIALGYTRAWVLDTAQAELEANLAVKRGFGEDDEPLTVADLGYGLVRPTLRGRYRHDGHTFTAELTGQITDVAVPEQQQWVLGGRGNLYASLPGLAIGDSGALAWIQWEPPARTLWSVQGRLKTFLEYGAARFESEVAGRNTDVRSQADIGAEVTITTPWGQEAAIGSAHAFATSNISDAAESAADANYYFRIRQSF